MIPDFRHHLMILKLTHLIVGFVISVLLGFYSIVMSYSKPIHVVALISFGIIATFTVINLVILFVFNKKLYQRMEV